MKNSPDHGAFETIIDNVRRLFDNFVGMFRRQQSTTAPENSSQGEPQYNIRPQDGQQNIPIMRQPTTLDTIHQEGESSQQSSLTQSSQQSDRQSSLQTRIPIMRQPSTLYTIHQEGDSSQQSSLQQSDRQLLYTTQSKDNKK